MESTINLHSHPLDTVSYFQDAGEEQADPEPKAGLAQFT